MQLMQLSNRQHEGEGGHLQRGNSIHVTSVAEPAAIDSDASLEHQILYNRISINEDPEVGFDLIFVLFCLMNG